MFFISDTGVCNTRSSSWFLNVFSVFQCSSISLTSLIIQKIVDCLMPYKLNSIICVLFRCVFYFLMHCISLPLCMPANFQFDGEHCEFYLVGCQIFLYSYTFCPGNQLRKLTRLLEIFFQILHFQSFVRWDKIF